MAEEKDTIILDFQINTGEAVSELEKSRKAIIQLKEEQAELNKQYKSGQKDIEEYAKDSVRLEQSLKKETATYNNLNKVVNTVSNSLEAQRLKLSQLVAERNKVDRSTAEGVKKFNDLNKSIKELNDTIKESEQAGGDFRRNVGNYSSAVEGFATNVQIGGTSIADLTGKMTAFLNPATAASGIVAGLGALYASSAAGAKDLEFAQAQLSQSFKTLSNDLADLLGADGDGGGLLSKFAFQINRTLFGISSATQGALSAAAQKTLKELEITELEAQRFAKKALDRSEQLRRDRDDDTKSFQERLKAASGVEAEINAREEALVEVQNKRLKALQSLLALDKNNLDLKKEIKQVEFEISDIQEDSQGKRTEALNGINTLLKEQNALTKEQAQIANTEKEKQNAQLAEEVRLKNQLLVVNERLNIEQDKELPKVEAIIKGKVRLGESIQKLIDLGNIQSENAKAQAQIEFLLQQNKLSNASTALNQVKSLLNEESAAYKTLAVAQATVDTYRAATAALAPPPIGAGPLFGPILAGTTITLGLANVAKILGIELSAAAGGGDFVTRGPQLLLVGDNPGGRERVTVEPLSGRGRTVMGGNMIKLAGGGVVETQSQTASARANFAFSNTKQSPVSYISITELREFNDKIQFKENLVTA
jgi:hypothetical protein